MMIKKPYRICNIPMHGIMPLEACPPNHATAVLKEGKEQYELRVQLPNDTEQNHTISICDGILYIREGLVKQPGSKRNIITRFLLPANVLQEKIHAVYRPYGIQVLMPKAPSTGIVIPVPIA